MKTIFIVITRGFLIRNILRSGVLTELKKSGARIVIFISSEKRQREIPISLRKEFEDDQVTLIGVRDIAMRGYSLFSIISGMLVYGSQGWLESRIGNQRKMRRRQFVKYIERYAFSLFSNIPFLKNSARWLEQNFFYQPMYASYFEQYKPDIVFSTSIMSKLDINMMKEARCRGIPTVSMPKGWDNVTKRLYRFVPDKLLVQNTHMQRAITRLQRVPKDHISVVGFPQFDWYTKKDILLTKEAYLRSVNLDPARALIFFGSEGIFAPDDTRIIETLIRWINENAFEKPCSLFIRPHFSNAREGRFEKYRNIPNVRVDENFTFSDFFGDHWDPTVPETIAFTNLITHADMLITVASTLTLDCACTDRPLINIGYGVLHHPLTQKDITHLLYTSDHYQWVCDTKAIDLVRSDEELKKSIDSYLRDPSRKAAKRARLREELCYRVDGCSSERVAQAILELIKKKNIK